MEWWLLATLAAATPDVGLGRVGGVPRLGAREEVRGFLPAVVVGVQDRHVPVDLRIVEPGATMAILEVVFNDDLTRDGP